jgi:hypothetical protein
LIAGVRENHFAERKRMKTTKKELHSVLMAHKRNGTKIPVMYFYGEGKEKKAAFRYDDADWLDGAALLIFEPRDLQIRTAEAIAKNFEIDAASLLCWFPIDSSIQEAYAFVPPAPGAQE